MRYYSDKLRKLFDNQVELELAEKEYDEAVAEEKAKEKKRKAAREVKLSELKKAEQEYKEAKERLRKIRFELSDDKEVTIPHNLLIGSEILNQLFGI